jgi:hypothetical protein
MDIPFPSSIVYGDRLFPSRSLFGPLPLFFGFNPPNSWISANSANSGTLDPF